MSLPEWFAGKAFFEILRRRWPSPERKSDGEIEDDLWETFGEKTISITPPVGTEHDDALVDVDDEIEGEVLDVEVASEGKKRITIVRASFDEALVDYLPHDEERAENSIRIWLDKDDLSVSFHKDTRLGPILEIFIPSTRKSEVNSSIEVVSEITSRVVYIDTTLAHLVYETLEAGVRIGTGAEELASTTDELSVEEAEEFIRVLAGSIAGHDPDTKRENEG